MTPELECALYQLLGRARAVVRPLPAEPGVAEVWELRDAVRAVDAAMGITAERVTQLPPAVRSSDDLELCPCGSGLGLLECGRRASATAGGAGAPWEEHQNCFSPPSRTPSDRDPLLNVIPPTCVKCLEPLTWVRSASGPGQWTCRGRVKGCARDP